MNYYNEFDKKAAAWLRALIEAKLIPEGTVDERSITEVQPADLVGYAQCHFFAGIGGWPEALRLAGWPADRRVWTGSCPCQPFSSAGKQKAQADERHLWPAFFELIRGYNAISQREPVTIFGEQVSSAIRHGWLDGVRTDLEGEGYTCGHAVLGAHSAGSPHIRQRLYWVGVPNGNGWKQGWPTTKTARYRDSVESAGSVSGLVVTNSERVRDQGCGSDDAEAGGAEGDGQERKRIRPDSGNANRRVLFRFDERSLEPLERLKEQGRISDDAIRAAEVINSIRLGESFQSRLEGLTGNGDRGDESRRLAADEIGSTTTTSPVDFWSHFDLIPCRDGKTRRVKSGVRCLAHGIPGRVAQLRGLGNAIVPQVAAEFIRAYMEVAK